VTSLGFEILDRHVVEGRGDEVACADETGSLTYSKLLERAAELAGGLYILGVRGGDHVEIDLPNGNVQVTAVCAVIRLGAIPAAHGDARICIVDGQARVRLHDHDLELAVVQRAGRAEPAPALRFDEPGFGDAATNAFEDIVESLLSGSPVV
jgi:acyl-coenzyme A synthetase/AMP-(fatty) acid ligase